MSSPQVSATSLPPADALHTTAQAAAALRVSVSTIKYWRRCHKIEPAGLLRAPVPGGYELQWKLADLEPLATAHHAARHARKTRS